MFPGPAEVKFWETPELIAKLLTFLDPPSTLRLGKCHQLTQDVIQGEDQVDQEVLPARPRRHAVAVGYLAHENLETVQHFVAILKLLRTPNTLLMDLLEPICKRFLAQRVSIQESLVYLSCTCQPLGECHV